MENIEAEGNPSRKKIQKCAEWLKYCLNIGYKKRDLDWLQKIWMQYHDDNGKFQALQSPQTTLPK